MSNLLSLKEVAEKLNLCYNATYYYIKTRKLRGIKLNKVWRVEPEELERFIQERKVKV